MKFLARLFVLIALISAPVFAVQYPPAVSTTSPYPGLTMLSNINSSFGALLSNNSGATAPSYQVAGTFFANTSSGLLEYYSGSNWLNLGTFSTTQWAGVNNGVPVTIPSSTGSTNAYVVTYSPAPTAYVTGQHYPFISSFANTTTASENVNGLGAKPITKLGKTALAGAEIGSGAVVDTVYDGTEMQMVSELSSVGGGGTVTSIATNNGVTGGTITGSGTIALAAISNNQVLANISGGSTFPSGTGAPVVTSYGIGQTTTGASAASFVGMHSTTGGALSLSTSGHGDALVINTAGTIVTGVWNGTAIGPTFLATATSSALGIVKPDNSTITISAGVISSTGNLPSAFGVGSYILGSPGSGNCGSTSGAAAANAVVAASTLTVCNANGSSTTDTITGNWRSMQTIIGASGTGGSTIGLFLRIN